MSVAALTWAFEQFLPAAEKVVLLVLADCENGHSHVCNPGQEFIARQASMSIRTVRTVIGKLEERQLISRERRSTPGGRRSDSYTLHRPGRPAFTTPPRDADDEQTQPADLAGSQPADLAGSRNHADLQTQPADLAGSATGNFEVPNRQTVAGTQEPEVKTINPPSPPEGGVSDSTTVEPTSPLFEQFWDAYPKHVERDDARQVWFSRTRGENGASPAAIIQAAMAYAEHHRRQGTDPQFVKTAGNWLRKGCYADPIPTYEPAPSPWRRLPQGTP